MNEIQIEVAERRNQCPIVDAIQVRLRPLEDFITGETAARKTSATWLKWLWPVIWAGAGAFAILVLINAPAILKLHQ